MCHRKAGKVSLGQVVKAESITLAVLKKEIMGDDGTPQLEHT